LVTAYVMATALAAVAAAAVMAYCHFARAPDDPLYVSTGVAVWFVVSTMAWSVFNLQDAALTGLRSAVWVPLENGLYGLVKLLLLVRRILPRHATAQPEAQQMPARGVLARYMAGDYAAQAFTQLSSTFLPV